MLSGHQIREACELLWWDRAELQRRSDLSHDIVDRILAAQDDAHLSLSDEVAVRDVFQGAGLKFTPNGGVRLRKDGA